MLSQSKGETVPQFGCSIRKCSDSQVGFFLCFFFFVIVSLVDTGDVKMKLDGGPQIMRWKVARY